MTDRVTVVGAQTAAYTRRCSVVPCKNCYCKLTINHCSAVNHFLGDTDTHTAGISILRAAVAVLRIPSSAAL